MKAKYEIQRRGNGGAIIRQGQGWIILSRDEVKGLVHDLNEHLGDPRNRVEEKNKIDNRYP